MYPAREKEARAGEIAFRVDRRTYPSKVCQRNWDVLNPASTDEGTRTRSLEACNILTNKL